MRSTTMPSSTRSIPVVDQPVQQSSRPAQAGRLHSIAESLRMSVVLVKGQPAPTSNNGLCPLPLVSMSAFGEPRSSGWGQCCPFAVALVERPVSGSESGSSRPTAATDHAGVPAGKRTFTARACAASLLVCDARAGFSLTQLDQSFPRDSPKVEGKGVRSPARNESQEPVSEPAPSAAMRSSAAAIIVLKRGSLRRGSRSGSTLA